MKTKIRYKLTGRILWHSWKRDGLRWSRIFDHPGQPMVLIWAIGYKAYELEPVSALPEKE